MKNIGPKEKYWTENKRTLHSRFLFCLYLLGVVRMTVLKDYKTTLLLKVHESDPSFSSNTGGKILASVVVGHF